LLELERLLDYRLPLFLVCEAASVNIGHDHRGSDARDPMQWENSRLNPSSLDADSCVQYRFAVILRTRPGASRALGEHSNTTGVIWRCIESGGVRVKKQVEE
jgi:hypothetical protein